jgi:hypothetical protein
MKGKDKFILNKTFTGGIYEMLRSANRREDFPGQANFPPKTG